jgi:uncharacterized protein (TIGR03083 family)
MDIDEVWRHIDAERRSLADTLGTLEDEAWENASLCPGWTVRDVAAHVIASPQYRWRDFVPMVIRARFDINRAILEDGQRRGRAPVADILEQFERFEGARTVPPTTTPYEPLVDILVHTQDMFRPLGIEHAMPADAAVAALDRVLGKHDKLFAAHGLDSVHVVATDVDWSRGSGPEVRAPVQEVLMLATGRAADGALVEGDGAALVRSA